MTKEEIDVFHDVVDVVVIYSFILNSVMIIQNVYSPVLLSLSSPQEKSSSVLHLMHACFLYSINVLSIYKV